MTFNFKIKKQEFGGIIRVIPVLNGSFIVIWQKKNIITDDKSCVLGWADHLLKINSRIL